MDAVLKHGRHLLLEYGTIGKIVLFPGFLHIVVRISGIPLIL